MSGSTPNGAPIEPLVIPDHVLRVHRRLVDAGHRSLLAGGAVRDHLLGRVAKDFDLATSAIPDAVDQLFEKTVLVGAQFGVVRVSHSAATTRPDSNSASGM